jgi:hypothetical protein
MTALDNQKANLVHVLTELNSAFSFTNQVCSAEMVVLKVFASISIFSMKLIHLIYTRKSLNFQGLFSFRHLKLHNAVMYRLIVINWYNRCSEPSVYIISGMLLLHVY